MDSDRERRIRERAYALWEAEGRPHGRDREHWHQAAEEIAAEEASSGKRPGQDAGPVAPAASSGGTLRSRPARPRKTQTPDRPAGPASGSGASAAGARASEDALAAQDGPDKVTGAGRRRPTAIAAAPDRAAPPVPSEPAKIAGTTSGGRRRTSSPGRS